MAIDLTQPLDVAYPVAFRSGGDTTKAAFGKHIQEIERIYGILNALNSDKLSASEFTEKCEKLESSISNAQSTLQSNLTSHINATNPHANWKVDLSSQITGSLDASKVSGDLSGATIDKSKITGLETYVKGFVKEEFNCSAYSNYGHAYANFAGGLQIRAGFVKIEDISDYESTQRTVYYNQSFTMHSLCVVLTLETTSGSITADWTPLLVEENKSYFKYIMNHVEGGGDVSNLFLHYIAFGH